MKCSNTPECPYCGEPLRCPGVVINTDKHNSKVIGGYIVLRK